jgi:hypothetical protein
MEAACRGAHASAHYQEGDTVGLLPGHEPAAANPWVDIALPTGLGHLRNALVAHADAVVAVGGGAGTLSEMAMAWIHDRLVVAVEVPGWSEELAGRKVDGRARLAGLPEDRVHAAPSGEAAVALVVEKMPAYGRTPPARR